MKRKAAGDPKVARVAAGLWAAVLVMGLVVVPSNPASAWASQAPSSGWPCPGTWYASSNTNWSTFMSVSTDRGGVFCYDGNYGTVSAYYRVSGGTNVYGCSNNGTYCSNQRSYISNRTGGAHFWRNLATLT